MKILILIIYIYSFLNIKKWKYYDIWTFYCYPYNHATRYRNYSKSYYKFYNYYQSIYYFIDYHFAKISFIFFIKSSYLIIEIIFIYSPFLSGLIFINKNILFSKYKKYTIYNGNCKINYFKIRVSQISYILQILLFKKYRFWGYNDQMFFNSFFL